MHSRETLGKYRLERELGRGGMGVVYLATDMTLSREVALKVVHPALQCDSQFAGRFEREARSIALLSHPNIVHVNAFVNEGGVLGIDMPYLSGGSLREQFTRGITSTRLIGYLIQILRALDYCHGMGVVHRDVKPSNVLLDERGLAKLSDFGLAKLLSETFRDSMVSGSTGCVVGTPCYTPPESWELAEPEPSWDLYATGVIAWEGLAGKLPYDANSPWQLISKLQESGPPPLHEVAPDVSPELVAVVEWMMQRDPAKRARSARELIDALQRLPEFVEEPETIASYRGQVHKRLAQTAPWRQRMAVSFRKWSHLAIATAGASGAIGIGAASAFLYQSSEQPQYQSAAAVTQPIHQREVAANDLPNMAGFLGSARVADGANAAVYEIASEPESRTRIQRAMLLGESEAGARRIHMYGERALWAGELTETPSPGIFEAAGTWLEAGSLADGGFASGSWKGSLKMLAGDRLALFQLKAIRDQDRRTFDLSAAGERLEDVTDTGFVHGLESNLALAPLLFREGVPRRHEAALWTESLLPAWVESRGVLFDVGDATSELDGQLSELYWTSHPGPIRARPLKADASLAWTMSDSAITFGARLPKDKVPATWELQLRLAPADAPDAQVFMVRLTQEGSGSIDTLSGENAVDSDASVQTAMSQAGEQLQIECSIKPTGVIGDMLQLSIPWRCNAHLFDVEQQRTVLEWGAPDVEALAHGALLVRGERGASSDG